MKLKILPLLILLSVSISWVKAQDVAHKIKFEKNTHDFGTQDQGAKTEYVFKFENVSDGPVKLTNVKASCGCTTPTWPKEEIAAGGTGEIHVKYNSNRIGPFNKSIRVTYAEGASPVTLYIKGRIMSTAKEDPTAAVTPPVEPKINYGIPRGALSFEKMIENLKSVSSEESKEIEFRFKNTSNQVVTILAEKVEAG